MASYQVTPGENTPRPGRIGPETAIRGGSQRDPAPPMRLTEGMSVPDPTDDERSIADTGMFKRFVEHEAELDQSEPASSSKGKWIATVAIVAIIAIAVVVWLLTR
jgi:hypothetical protein